VILNALRAAFPALGTAEQRSLVTA
jgi:hypothetical protein